ncbi:hypothetical protein UO65_4629 [Actinokineospora spheciospongiae]|uniref:Uncharacterized protein n=1 Tax=Actinokineospora spheciospongiae TaxID=909613 RepID=W7IIP3_9PSEU|nr:hypothetical protein [Actinokineospora spheciospongiae]EWC60063.1 hypothetical protein UO65_4629 [Actinokineospora spheciospongiae]PWW65640.1 hypothetical protein DFQ13_102395 [Actinokineospora spheciospongiae]
MTDVRTHCLTTLAKVARAGWPTTLRMALLMVTFAAVLAAAATVLPTF